MVRKKIDCFIILNIKNNQVSNKYQFWTEKNTGLQVSSKIILKTNNKILESIIPVKKHNYQTVSTLVGKLISGAIMIIHI